MSELKPTKQATFSLAKGLNHLQNAIFYFEDASNEMAVTMKAKQFMKEILNRLNWCNREFMLKLKTADAKEALRDELANAATIDSLMNLVIALPEDLRQKVEDFAVECNKVYEDWKKEQNEKAA